MGDSDSEWGAKHGWIGLVMMLAAPPALALLILFWR